MSHQLTLRWKRTLSLPHTEIDCSMFRTSNETRTRKRNQQNEIMKGKFFWWTSKTEFSFIHYTLWFRFTFIPCLLFHIYSTPLMQFEWWSTTNTSQWKLKSSGKRRKKNEIHIEQGAEWELRKISWNKNQKTFSVIFLVRYFVGDKSGRHYFFSVSLHSTNHLPFILTQLFSLMTPNGCHMLYPSVCVCVTAKNKPKVTCYLYRKYSFFLFFSFFLSKVW